MLVTLSVSATEVLIKLDMRDMDILSALGDKEYSIRFRGKSFLLIQGDESIFMRSSYPYTILDKIKADNKYYLVRIGYRDENLWELHKLGNILLVFNGSALISIFPAAEPSLIALGLPLSQLPEKVYIRPRANIWTAPRIKPPSEMAFDDETVGDIVSSVSIDEIGQIIYNLQENRDLDPPYTPYRSRYCLRVRETDDPSDEACDNAADYIYNRFKSYGLDVEYDLFPHEVLTQGHYEMRNVVATLPGKGLNSERVFIVCSHYDTVASKSSGWQERWKSMPAPGADDNASGTAAVLEAARILSEYDFDCTIKFITFSGEELGLHGSRHYANMVASFGDDIAGVINFDMIAYDPDLLDVDVITNEESQWLVDAMLSIQKRYGINPLVLRKIVNPEMVYSDHAPFWDNGWNAILGIDNSNFDSPEFNPFMHSTEDTVETLNLDMTFRVVQIAVGTLASLADPLGGTPHPDLAVFGDDIRLSPDNPNRGQPVQVIADIRNIGEVDAESTRVQVWVTNSNDNTSQLITEKMISVRAASSAQVSASLEFGEWGDYQVLIKANPEYEIFEPNGSNNVARKPIRIGSDSLALGKLMLYPNPMSPASGDLINMAYSLSKDADTRLEIYDSSGNLVYQKYFIRGESGGKFGFNNTIEWDGTNFRGEKVSAGIYFCYVIAADGNGDTKSVSKKFLITR
jgi:hypothetical protein